MTRIERGIIALAMLELGAAASLTSACSDDEVAGDEDASTPDAEPPADTGSDAAQGATWTINAGFFNARSQPKAPLPQLLVPSQFIQVVPAEPPRRPDLVVPGPFPPLGCTAYKFTTVDPRAPGGPRFSDGDFGRITLSGFSGGTSADASAIPDPLLCDRVETFPGTGLFSYRCAFPEGPTSGFLAPTDNLTLTIQGGNDGKGLTLENNTVSKITNLVVANDLWDLPPSSLDGSSDLKITYDCGGEACTGATTVAILIDTTDGRSDAGAPTPFDFPSPASEFAQILCIALFPPNAAGYTVPKEVLAMVPSSWTAVRTTIATIDATQAFNPDRVPISMFAGEGVFGITHR